MNLLIFRNTFYKRKPTESAFDSDGYILVKHNNYWQRNFNIKYVWVYFTKNKNKIETINIAILIQICFYFQIKKLVRKLFLKYLILWILYLFFLKSNWNLHPKLYTKGKTDEIEFQTVSIENDAMVCQHYYRINFIRTLINFRFFESFLWGECEAMKGRSEQIDIKW